MKRVMVQIRTIVVRTGEKGDPFNQTGQFVVRGTYFEIPDDEVIDYVDYSTGSSNVPSRRAFANINPEAPWMESRPPPRPLHSDGSHIWPVCRDPKCPCRTKGDKT